MEVALLQLAGQTYRVGRFCPFFQVEVGDAAVVEADPNLCTFDLAGSTHYARHGLHICVVVE